MTVQDNNPDRVSVFLDEAFAFGVYQDLVLEYGLYTGRVLGVEEQQQIIRADRELGAKRTALRYVASRPRTVAEVRRKLQRSDVEEDVIDRVVERLRALHYLDDAAYVQDYVRARFSNRGYGPGRIRNELLRRGIDRLLVDEALDAMHDRKDDVLEAARAHARKRWVRLENEPDPYKRRKKLGEHLLRKGFTYDTIRRVADELERSE